MYKSYAKPHLEPTDVYFGFLELALDVGTEEECFFVVVFSVLLKADAKALLTSFSLQQCTFISFFFPFQNDFLLNIFFFVFGKDNRNVSSLMWEIVLVTCT